jgi:bifunctional non-homologous end joining protein LigD
VFYVFDLLMLRGKDSRLSPLEQRRKRLRKIVDGLPEIIRYSETFTVPAETLIRVLRENGLEGIVAKRAGSTYRSGRSGDWVKWRANRGLEFVIGGYIPASSTLDSLLVGYFQGHELVYAGRIRAGLVAETRRALLSHFAQLRIDHCPFRNLPERTKGRWGEGLAAEDMVAFTGTLRSTDLNLETAAMEAPWSQHTRNRWNRAGNFRPSYLRRRCLPARPNHTGPKIAIGRVRNLPVR